MGTASASPLASATGARHFEQVRSELQWVPVKLGSRKLSTPDAASRIKLAKSAANLARLDEVGLDFRDVYGVINAETAWVPRDGMGKNGVASLGIAQFEPATAKGVGLKDPQDPVAAVHAAAVLLKDAAEWSSKRIASLKLTPEARAAKLREGVSIFYNLSTRGRAGWSGTNTNALPVETQRHILNVRNGALEAERLHARLGGKLAPGAVQMAALPAATVASDSNRKAAVQVARAEKAVPERLAKPVVVAGRDGRKTWIFPQGQISWSVASKG